LQPLGVVMSSVLLSMFYIGGELAQSRLGLPKALSGVFQGLLLLSLLMCDTSIHYQLELPWPRRRAREPAAVSGEPASDRGGA
jgi:simple sugar transport system permease protein